MWKNRRRTVALLGGAAALLLPFLRIRGRSAARFDLPTLSLHFFGAVVPIDEFHLVLLGALFLAALTLLVTVVFGRLWCGWLCPQTVIGEIGEWIASALPPRVRSGGKTLALLPFSAVVSLSLLWYFVPPAEATRDLFRSPVLLGFFLSQWAVIYIMVAVVGPRFCKTACPYAMLQNVLADGETLAVAYDPARAECLRCDQCTRVCPVGIDIRKGGQRECVACASCIDACREVTSRRNIAPFIAYRGTVLRGKAYLFAGGCLAAALVLLAAVWTRPDVRFAVQWEGKAGTPGGNVYRYSVQNDSDRPVTLSLSVERPARLLDDPEVAVPSRRRVTGAVTVKGGDGTPEQILITAEGRGFRIVRKAAFPSWDGNVDRRYSEAGGVLRGAIGGQEVLLSITPWPPGAMREVDFTVSLPGYAGTASPYIELSMSGMEMGRNRVDLSRGADGRYRGTGVIVRCPSGKRDWEATVTVQGAGKAVFRFAVAD